MPTYFKNFNSLRFYAFLLVFIGHVVVGFQLEENWLKNFSSHYDLSHYGVIFFFVLSGFLITIILLKGQQKNQKVNILYFYTKRVRRIWPVYFMVIVVGFLIVPLFIYIANKFGLNMYSVSGTDINSLPWFIFFISNIYISYFGFLSPIINILWSVAIEEQFYIVWPWFVKYTRNNLLIFIILILVFVFSVLFRYFDFGSLAEHIHTFACIGSLAIGCLGAYLTFYNQKVLDFFTNLKWIYSLSIYLLIALSFILICFKEELHLNNALSMSLIYAILSILFLVFILEQGLSKKPLIPFGKSKVTEYLGTISYGLYAYHMIAFTVIVTILKVLNLSVSHNLIIYILAIIVTFILTILISYLSYKYIERPIINKNIKSVQNLKYVKI